MRKLAAAGLGRQVATAADRENFGAEVEALAQQGIPIYASLRQMLAQAREGIDVVCLPLGIALHRPMTIAALEAGCHVVVEKPAAGSVQDVDAMLATRDRSGRLCAVGFQHLYRGEIQQLKRRIVAGEFGRIQRIKGYGCWPRQPSYYRRNAWAGCLAMGDTWVLDSPHHNALGHAVNLMCYLGSAQPAAAVASSGLTRGRATSSDSMTCWPNLSPLASSSPSTRRWANWVMRNLRSSRCRISSNLSTVFVSSLTVMLRRSTISRE